MSVSIPDKQVISDVWTAVKNRSIPLKPLTKAEYDVLDETQRNAEIAYLVQTSNSINLIYKGLSISESGSSQFSDTPIGTVISFMGTSAPDDYLICDGTIYNISDYSDLSDFFAEQFGTKNYFGGNGATTFAVPDMRNLFLRGYHGSSSEQLSGDIGKTQKATEIPHLEGGVFGANHPRVYITKNKMYDNANEIGTVLSNEDSSTSGVGVYYALDSSFGQDSALNSIRFSTKYTSRPVNMAVLFCIKAKVSKASVSSGCVTEHRVEEIVQESISKLLKVSIDYRWLALNMESGSSPAPYVVSASSYYDKEANQEGPYLPYYAFDSSLTTFWHSSGRDSSPWIQVDFGGVTYVNGLRMYPRTNQINQFPKSFTIQGSNDGDTWVTIKSINKSVSAYEWHVYNFEKATDYRYYRIADIINSAGSSYKSIAGIEFSVGFTIIER